MPITLELESRLAAPASEVWAAVSTLEGVNQELSPWVRMTSPPDARSKSLLEAPVDAPIFTSTLLAFRCLPFDRHELRLVEASHGHFLERSRSILQRSWEHERWVEPIEGGTLVRDRLKVEPRFAPEPLIRAVVSALFRWRHRRLRQRFGEASA